MVLTLTAMVSDGSSPTYVDTPYGMVTGEGRWYHISEEEAKGYAGEVLEHVSLDSLIQWADVWIDSPRILSLWLLPVFLWTLPSVWAVVGTILVYVGWGLASPAFPSIGGARIASGLSNVLVQGGYYVVVLSLFSVNDQFEAVGIGLGGFILFRWGVVDWAARSLFKIVRRKLYPLPITDQVLRGLMVRAALKYRVSVPQVDDITRDILENWGAHSDSDREDAD